MTQVHIEAHDAQHLAEPDLVDTPALIADD